MTVKRIEWIDRWKGLLILLVVLGHVVGGGWHFAHGEVQTALMRTYQGIYMFHMPAFAFLAGMMWTGKEQPFGSFVRKKFMRLMVPYYIFGLASIALYAVFAGSVVETMRSTETDHYAHIGATSWWTMPIALLHGGGWPGDGFRANSVLWFLPCLFSSELIYYWVNKAFDKKLHQLWLLPVLIIAMYGMRLYPGWPLPMGLSRAPEFLFFMIAGRFLVPTRVSDAVKPHLIASILLTVMVLVGYGMLVKCVGGVWAWHSGVSWLGFFCLVSVFGILMSIAVASVARVSALSWLGMYSIGIMLMHKPLLMAVQLKVKPVFSCFAGESAVVALVAAVGLTIGIAAVCSVVAVGLRRWLPWALGDRRLQ